MAGLKEINHIVVLMLENRSFDHMLGYLHLFGIRPDLDGLTGNEVNEYPAGTPHHPQLLVETTTSPDPHHDWDNVKNQLDNNNGGFIADFATNKPKPDQPERVMNYYDAKHVPVFDHLAKQFCVCDRWFSSIPGPTQPNRMYALAGESAGRKDNLPNAQLLTGGWNVKPFYQFLPKTVSWRHYSHDIASLRFIKGYQGLVNEIDKVNKFFDRAKNGTLTNISWIDPDFGTLIYPGPSNDDHPHHDISNGQNLVRRVYNALLNGPKSQWERTLLVVTYDEHGGFYDHVSPR
jgi:phospholipase C